MTNTQEYEISQFETCALCGSDNATTSIVHHEFDYLSGNKMKVLSAHVPVVKCSECEEAYFGQGAEEIKHKAVCDFLDRMTPAAIFDTRNILGMSQTQLAKKIGIGVASIKRWETGNVIQSAILDDRLRVLKTEAAVGVLNNK